MKRIFLGTILFLSSVFAIITYATSLPWGVEESETNGFIAPLSGSKDVATPEGCRKISGVGVSQSYFAPTKTTTEWNAFKAHLPAGISIGACIVPVNGSCNNSTSLGCGSGSIAYSDNGQTACSTTRTWVCKSTTGGADSPLCSKANPICSGTRYPGCNTDDINLSNGQKWAACNVGATTSDVTNVTSYGNYYQWGRNNTGFSEGWLPTDENYWNPGNSNDSQGPCASGYHVPKKEEWCQAINTTIYGTNSSICQNGKIYNTSFRNTLKLSPAGYRNISVPYVGALLSNGTYGYYWANSYNDDEVGYNHLNFNNSWLFFDNKGDFAGRGFSVRCVRDL